MLAEQADTCPMCGHLISECRDPRTAGQWQVVEQTCEPSRVTDATRHNLTESGVTKRGLVLLTRRT